MKVPKFGLGKVQSHKKFDYTPRFYDEEKERREERVKNAKLELGLHENDETYIPDLKGKMRRDFRERIARDRKSNRNSNLRVFFILAILLGIAYVYIKFFF